MTVQDWPVVPSTRRDFRSMLGTAVVLPLLMALPVLAQTLPTTPAEPSSFLAAARTVTASIQKTYWKPRTGLYAKSIDKRDPDFLWGSGIMFSALVAAARHEPEIYRPVLDQFFTSLHGYWDAQAKVPGYEPAPTSGGGHDKYYDDNAWMVLTFLEAYDLTHEAKYLDRAEETLVFVLSGWDEQLGGGIWWHELHKSGNKNTCINAPAAVACLRMARYRQRPDNLAWARKLVTWTNQHLQDHDGLFFDNQNVATGKINRVKLTYNTALMLRANLGLHRATGEAEFLAEAQRIGQASTFFIHRDTGAYRDAPKWAHLLVEADLELYRATGDPSVLARARRHGEVAYARWQKSPPKELIDQAAIARTLWLLADHETDTGRKFWAQADAAGPLGK